MQRDNRGTTAFLTPQIKLLDGLGKPIWGVREAIVPLLSLCMPLYSLYYPPTIPVLSPYYPLIILLHGVI